MSNVSSLQFLSTKKDKTSFQRTLNSSKTVKKLGNLKKNLEKNEEKKEKEDALVVHI